MGRHIQSDAEKGGIISRVHTPNGSGLACESKRSVILQCSFDVDSDRQHQQREPSKAICFEAGAAAPAKPVAVVGWAAGAVELLGFTCRACMAPGKGQMPFCGNNVYTLTGINFIGILQKK